jgi:hypothetical protein
VFRNTQPAWEYAEENFDFDTMETIKENALTFVLNERYLP